MTSLSQLFAVNIEETYYNSKIIVIIGSEINLVIIYIVIIVASHFIMINTIETFKT